MFLHKHTYALHREYTVTKADGLEKASAHDSEGAGYAITKRLHILI